MPDPDSPKAPRLIRETPALRWLGRFWGEGVTRGPTPRVDETAFAWAREDGEGFVEAARAVADRRPIEPGSGAARLRASLDRDGNPSLDRSRWRELARTLLRIDPGALVDAAHILRARPDAVRAVLLRPGYADPASIGGALDRDLPSPVATGQGKEARP